MRPPLLVIGHSDAAGTHGIAADLRAAEALGAEPLPVVTSFTTGNETAPATLTPVLGRSLQRQLSRALDREPVAALIGVISRARHVRLVARQIAERGPSAIVLAPMPSAFDLAPLVSHRVFAAHRRFLVPEARTIVLPADAADAFLGTSGGSVDELRDIGNRLLGLGAQTAWVRAGQQESRRVDVLIDSEGSGLLDYQPGSDEAIHSAPASLAALLAIGTKLREAIERAHRYSSTKERQLHAV